MDYRIFPPQGLIEARVAMPLSKSESARSLIISSLTPGGKTPSRLAECDDTVALARALTQKEPTVDVGASGTAMRFLTGYYAAKEGCEVELRGTDRMHERPIGVLVEALRRCGADIEYLGKEGYPPLRIRGRRLTGGVISIDASVSSQFVSSLMMIGPLMQGGLTLDLSGEISSAPYITLTASMMREAGAEVEVMPMTVTINEGGYVATDFKIGGDWSAASYWFEIEALTSGFLRLERLDSRSIQGDRSVVELFGELGVAVESGSGDDEAIDLVASPDLTPRLTRDFACTPDLVQTAVVTCVMLGIPFRFSGVKSLRIKETDRIEALQREMLKLGAIVVSEADDNLEWDGHRRPVVEMPEFDTYSDHRMAMSLAPVACYIPGIVVRDCEVVEKSYPEYFDHLREAGFIVVDAAMPAEEVETLLEQQAEQSGMFDEDEEDD